MKAPGEELAGAAAAVLQDLDARGTARRGRIERLRAALAAHTPGRDKNVQHTDLRGAPRLTGREEKRAIPGPKSKTYKRRKRRKTLVIDADAPPPRGGFT